jgi:ribbon-helix-helix CopG family protein
MPKLVRSRTTRAVKTTLNLPAASSEILRALADQRGTSLAEVIRRALQLEQYLTQVRDEGGRILIEKKDDQSPKELVIF